MCELAMLGGFEGDQIWKDPCKLWFMMFIYRSGSCCACSLQADDLSHMQGTCSGGTGSNPFLLMKSPPCLRMSILNQYVTGFVLTMLYPPPQSSCHLWAGGSPGGVRKSMVQLGTHRKKPQDFKSWGKHRTMIHLPGFNIPLWLGKSNSILLDKSVLTQRVDNKLYANRQR